MTLALQETWARAKVRSASGGGRTRTALLACGILSSLLYALLLLVVPLSWEGYNSADMTVSELSAIGAPTRQLWTPLGLLWAVLYSVFGWGVWASAGGSRRLRVAGAAIVGAAVIGIFWPPMHLREVLAVGGGTLSDTLHVWWTVANGVLTLLAMGAAAAAFAGRFRWYTILTMATLVATGAMTSTYVSRMEANLPTPGMGAWERINIAAWLLWIVVLAIVLLSPRLQWGRAR